MLDRRYQQPLGFRPAQDDVDRLGRAAGENDRPVQIERPADPRPRIFERSACQAALGVGRRGIGPAFQALSHRSARSGQQRCRRGMIEIEPGHRQKPLCSY